MRFRTFLILVLGLAVVYAALDVSSDNGSVLRQELLLWGGMSVTMGWALFWAFSAGVIIALVFNLSRDLGLVIERWRQRKEGRRYEEIEEEYSRGLVAVVEGREEEALRHFRAVLERDSRHFNTLIKIGEVLRSQGKCAQAIEYHRKAHHLKEDSTRPLYALVEDHEAEGNMERARAVVGRIIALNKGSVAAWRKLRALHVKDRDWVEAWKAQQRVVKLAAPTADTADQRVGLGIRYEMAMARLAEDKPRDAAASLRRLIKEHPSFIPAHVGLGHALREGGHEAEAVQAWYAGFEATGSPIFLTVLEEHYLDREEPLAGIEALKRCISRARKDTLPRFYLGKLYFRLEMLDDALAVLSQLEGRATYAPTLHYLLGRIHERRRNHREAAVEYRKVIKEMELVQLDYTCRRCGELSMEWTGRCSACGEWNTVEVNFREEIPFEELGIAAAPIYPART
jgi:lipopolysaccharide biosynthesis regulator YciM